MLSFDSSIQKSADLKTQSSSGSWVGRVLLTPSNIYLWTFIGLFWFILFLRMCTASPWAPFWGQFRKIKKKKLSDFVVVHFLNLLDSLSFFQRPLLLHPLQKHFQGVDNVDGVPLGTFFFGTISKNEEEKNFVRLFFFFFDFFLFDFFLQFLKIK